jgi:hypothetical protein
VNKVKDVIFGAANIKSGENPHNEKVIMIFASVSCFGFAIQLPVS